ncbi:MAG: hypothetical protein V4722_00760 [Bacteroidota bacterium]
MAGYIILGVILLIGALVIWRQYRGINKSTQGTTGKRTFAGIFLELICAFGEAFL